MNTETIKSRIAKLLRLAADKGASEGEAASAMAMASRLMAEHSLSQADISTASDNGVKVEWGKINPAHNKSNWPLTILAAVCELYPVKYIRYGRSNDYRFAGPPDAIEAAEQTFLWLVDQVNAIYKVHLKQFGGRMTYDQRCEYRDTFKAACALRLWHRAAEIKASLTNSIPNHKALVVVENKIGEGIKGLFAEMNVKTGRALKVARGSGTREGMAAASAIQLQRAATGQTTRRLT